MTLALLREAGIEADGEVMDPDPYAAVMDALGEQDYDEIIISTHPETRSGLAARRASSTGVQRATRRPGRARGGGPRRRARRREAHARRGQPDGRARGRCSTLLKRKAAEEPRRFIVIAPQSGGNGDSEDDAARAPRSHAEGARGRRARRRSARSADPDPFTAIQNALQFYAPDDIVISTFPETRSGWLRADLSAASRRRPASRSSTS